MSKRFLLLILFIVLIPLPAPADSVETHVLRNGLKVILVEEHKAPVVTIQVWYRAGSRNEVTGKTGLAHLTEHMMFKGTRKFGKGEFSRIIARNGGTENAFTGQDYTAYFENLSSDRIDLALELEADRMVNLLLNPKEFALEREVVKEERRLRTDDDPQSLVVEQLYATAFQVHPYHSPIIGWMTDLNHLEQKDAAAFYRRYYSPSNATLVVVGDMEPKRVLQKIEQTFGRLPKRKPVPDLTIVEPEQTGERRFIVKKEARLPMFLAGYRVPNFRHPDNYPLTVLSKILGAGKSSRLYRNLVHENPVALDVGGDYSHLSADPELFYIYGVPLPGRTPVEIEEALFGEIERLKTEPVTERELQKAINQIQAAFIMDQDSNFYRAMKIGMAETIGAGLPFQQAYVKHIETVTAEDILRGARTYLREENRTVGVLMPLNPKPDERRPENHVE
ncbi:MAG TPA: pitrilysin family protein [Nitrospiria bacterium]